MIKKLSAVLSILVVAALTIWLYLANKFEKIAIEEMLPKLQEDDSLIAFNGNSIIIDKYKFKLTLQDVEIFPKSELFRVHADEITACYNPFSDNIKAQITGDKMTIGTGDLEIYFPSPNHWIDFNRSLIKSNFENFKVKISSKDSSLYFSDDDKFISKSDSSRITISNSLSDGMYDMNLRLKINTLQINPESQLFEKILSQIPSDLSKNRPPLQIDSYYYKMLDETGPINYETQYSVQLGKEHVHNIIALLKGKMEAKDVLEKIAFTKDIYSIDVREKIKNSALEDSGEITFSNDGEKIKAAIDFALNRSYNEEQKNNITEICKNLLLDGLKILNEENPSKVDSKLSTDDFTEISKILTDINKIEAKIDIEYDVKSNNLEQEIKFILNDFKIKSEGEVKDKVYNGTIEVSEPKLITETIPNIYEFAIRPIFAKLADSNEEVMNIAVYDKISKNIQENGFNALSVFHKDDELEENSELISELTFDPTSFTLKINDKGFLEILTDEKITNFLENMPNEEEVEDKEE